MLATVAYPFAISRNCRIMMRKPGGNLVLTASQLELPCIVCERGRLLFHLTLQPSHHSRSSSSWVQSIRIAHEWLHRLVPLRFRQNLDRYRLGRPPAIVSETCLAYIYGRPPQVWKRLTIKSTILGWIPGSFLGSTARIWFSMGRIYGWQY